MEARPHPVLTDPHPVPVRIPHAVPVRIPHPVPVRIPTALPVLVYWADDAGAVRTRRWGKGG
ncbi:hypothetical protein [Streptomyces cellulosae]|uniref:Uncharacterized protein n=1 Tax=Streptomyces cellulosae TaxID=1968 RepID=A0ABW7XZ76_STRCE